MKIYLVVQVLGQSRLEFCNEFHYAHVTLTEF